MKKLCYLAAVVITILWLDDSSATDIVFEASPDTIIPVDTKILRLRCTIEDSNTTSTAAPAVGRRDLLSSSARVTRDVDISHINSIIITRVSKDTGDNETVATVSTYDSENTTVDGGMIIVHGDTNPPAGSGEKGYLDVVWDHPGEDQAGDYFCEINALNSQLHSEFLSAAVSIGYVEPTIEDLTKYIALNDRYILQLNSLANDLLTRVNKLEADSAIKAQQDLQNFQSISKDISDLKLFQSNFKGSNLQTGSVTCDNVYAAEDKPVTFATPYSGTPSVLLAIRTFSIANSYSANAEPFVKMVTNTDMVIQCGILYVNSFTLDWIAFES